MALAVPRVAPAAGTTGPTRLEHLHGHPVTRLHPPALRRGGADRFDDPDGLVARDERAAGMQLAGVLLVVGAAQPARLDPQETVVIADLGQRERLLHEVARGLQHEGPGVRRSVHGRVLVTTPRVLSARRRAH